MPRSSEERKNILLRAAYDLLTRSDRASYVIEAAAILTAYDGTACDGSCLREDIAHELNIEPQADPIPLPPEYAEDEQP